MTPRFTRAEECFYKSIQALGPIDGLLVALSGGADSVVLLHLAHRYAHLLGGRVEALHVHHGIRGQEADRDCAFCHSLCERLGIPLTVRSFHIPSLSQEEGKGIEETARHYRYLAMDETADEKRLALIATAHTATDDLETILLQLTRGAAGVIGIPAVRERYFRPLLSVTRQDILDYLDQWNLPHVEDSTNGDDLYSRNLIRHQVLPVLHSLNPKVEEAFGRAKQYSNEDSAYLDTLALPASESGDLQKINALPNPLRRRALVLRCRKLGFAELSSVHLEALMHLVCQARPHASLSLPGGTIAIEGNCLVRTQPTEEKPWKKVLQMGENPLPDGSLLYLSTDTEEEIEKYISSKQIIYKLLTKATFHSAIIGKVLSARSRLPGDRILMGGIHRKVKKLYCDAALPLSQRTTAPIICIDDEVLWIPAIQKIRDQTASDDHTSTHLIWLK